MLGITVGDPAGIGPETILKALNSLSLHAKHDNLILIGNKKQLENLQCRYAGQNFRLAKYSVVDAYKDFKYRFGKPDKKCGTASFLQLHLASYLLKTKVIKGIVTAPVSKTALQMAGFPYDGQTEYFASEFGVKNHGMLAWSDKVKIILVTIHKPLKDVSKLITTEKVLEKIILLNNYLKNYEKIRKPRIGVFSLNPHSFEFTCGAEDKIMKAIQKARKLGISCYGPIPADSAFSNLGILESSNLRIAFDAFVAMYHDQGMLPVKLLSKGAGVNMTLGLPFIRTSPLHGTAFDIAGKGVSDPSSMISAIELCKKLVETS
jgi:4-hydroxythreonine-4-phosphate dehydrogenase